MESSHEIQPDSLAELSRDTFVRETRFHGEIDSTNTAAMQLLADDPRLITPLLVYADRQTAGRGRGDHQWWTATGSLTFSLIIDAESIGLSRGHHPQLSLLSAIALAHAVDALQPFGTVAVKWPNDVYLSGRKLAGILVETTGDHPSMHVVGIGVNVNNSFEAAPADVRGASVSLAETIGAEVDRLTFLRALLLQLDAVFSAFAQDPRSLQSSWRPFCLLTGKTVSIGLGGKIVGGVCRGIDPTGALQVETDRGMQSFHSGSVMHWH